MLLGHSHLEDGNLQITIYKQEENPYDYKVRKHTKPEPSTIAIRSLEFPKKEVHFLKRLGFSFYTSQPTVALTLKP